MACLLSGMGCLPFFLVSSSASPVNILSKSIAGRHRPVRVADGPITARYRFIKNASWVGIKSYVRTTMSFMQEKKERKKRFENNVCLSLVSNPRPSTDKADVFGVQFVLSPMPNAHQMKNHALPIWIPNLICF